MSAWLGVVSADHVRRGVELGIAQLGHGKRNMLTRMHADDWLVYYSPRISLEGDAPLKAFTAVGRLPDDDIWQGDDGDFHPFRRRVDYQPDAREIPIATLKDELDLTSAPNWGYQLRRGLIALSVHDLDVIRRAMVGS